jgi:putative cardiolipin synthase
LVKIEQGDTMRKSYILVLIVSAILFGGCAGKHINTTEGTVVVHDYKKASDSLYFLAKDDVASHAPKSGFYPLHHNLDAFMARVILIENAKKSLDLQYFIYAEDEVAYALTQLLVEAADRGVKVRILIDDLLKKDSDVKLEALTQHPNIEIKLFNPTSARKSMGWLQMAFNVDTLGRRMHNKLLVADNSAAVIGGRNIEDIYFAADKKNIFIDNDVLAIGPIAAEASNEFETYWRSKISVNIKELISQDSTEDYEILRKGLFKSVNTLRHNEYVNEAAERDFYKQIHAHELPLYYGDAHIYFDIPTKITTSEEDTSTHLSAQIRPLFSTIDKSLKIINPYFIPNESMMKTIAKLRSRGVEIYIVTNSLATNDGIPVYSAYSRYQKELLELGVHLYELNPHSFEYIYKNQKYRRGSIPRSSLHAKSMILDDEIFLVGSMNLDPRSIKLNTEILSVIHSKELAEIESQVFDKIRKPQNVFTLSIEKKELEKFGATTMPGDPRQVVWSTEKDGKIVKYYDDGNAGFWRRLGSIFSRMIPMDKYL